MLWQAQSSSNGANSFTFSTLEMQHHSGEVGSSSMAAW
jgi:hypothetical protein